MQVEFLFMLMMAGLMLMTLAYLIISTIKEKWKVRPVNETNSNDHHRSNRSSNVINIGE